MKTSPPFAYRLAAVLPALVLLGALLGCHSGGARLKLTSFKDPYFPEEYTLELAQCVFRVAPGGDLHVAGRAETRDAHGRPLTQFLHVHVYWQPQPGKTPADASATNALLRYVVAGADGVAVYAGTSFAFPKYVRGDRLRLTLEKGRLLPQTTSGDLPEFLGSTSLAGRLLADPDPGVAAQLVREMDLLAPR